MNDRELALFFILVGAGALLWYSSTQSGSDIVQSVASTVASGFVNRGIRNANPGNIRRSSILWNNSFADQASCEAAGRVWDTDFVVFYTMPDGERALGHVLLTYQNSYDISTVRGVISRYAPSTENDTANYINNVASRLNVDPDTAIDIYSILPQLAQAIMTQETGFTEDPSTLSNAVYS